MAVAALTVWALGGGAKGGAARSPLSVSHSAVEQSGGTPSGTVPGHKPNVRIWVHRDGVRPAVVRTRPGRIILRAMNMTQSDVTLVVERVRPGASPQAVTKVVSRLHEWGSPQEVALGDGEYVYYEESRPESRGRLVVGRVRQ